MSRFLVTSLLTLLLALSLLTPGTTRAADDSIPLGFKGLVLGMTKADVLARGLTACGRSRIPFMEEECSRPAEAPELTIGGHAVDYAVVWLVGGRVHGLGLFIAGNEEVFNHVRAAVASKYGALSEPVTSTKATTQELTTQALLSGGWIGVRWTRWLNETSSSTVYLLVKSPTFMALGARPHPEHTRQRDDEM